MSLVARRAGRPDAEDPPLTADLSRRHIRPLSANGDHGFAKRAAVFAYRHPARMSRLVMKFGGTSVANVERIRNVARHVKREIDAGFEVAVVVSAMAGKTNELVAWCREAAPLFDQREYDAVVASGEQVTAGLLAIALQEIGVSARSWLGWQIPILTDAAHGSARIESNDGAGIRDGFERCEGAVVAGFQGIGRAHV